MFQVRPKRRHKLLFSMCRLYVYRYCALWFVDFYYLMRDNEDAQKTTGDHECVQQTRENNEGVQQTTGDNEGE